MFGVHSWFVLGKPAPFWASVSSAVELLLLTSRPPPEFPPPPLEEGLAVQPKLEVSVEFTLGLILPLPPKVWAYRHMPHTQLVPGPHTG